MTARVPGLDDVTVEIEGLRHGAGFVLFLGDGLLDMLEGYSYGEPWPSRVGRFSLQRHPRASLPLP